MEKLPRKHILALCLACCFSIGVFAQQVSFRVKNVTVKTAVIKFKKTTGYSFVFGSGKVDTNKRISVNANNQPLRDVVAQILSGQNLDYEINGKFIIVKERQQVEQKAVNPQRINSNNSQIKATGRVTDENGEPIIGATVKVKGSSQGTVTDLNGEFSINTLRGSILEISYIGYNSRNIRINGQINLSIVMRENTQSLSDVVVIGYGSAKRVDLTGAISSLDGSKLTDKSTPQLSTLLEGQVAGLQVTHTSGNPVEHASILVRGITTMSTNTPLIIVDGVPVSNIDDISSDDVENMQFLKDAAAASIYGSRAAAGVILITTKRAKNGKFSMSYNVEYGIDVPTTTPTYGNAVEWMTGLNELKYNDGSQDLYSAYSQDFINSYNENHTNNPDKYPDVDWENLCVKKSTHHQQHTFNLSGGTDKLATNFSFNYYDTDYLIDNEDYQRMNMRMNNDYKINNWIHAVADVNMNYELYHTPQTNFESIRQTAPIYPAVWSDGTYADGKDGVNQYADIHLGGFNNYKYYKVQGKLQLDLNPFSGLTVSAVVSPFYYFLKGKSFYTSYQLRESTGDNRTVGATALSENRNDIFTLTTQLYVNYQKTFAKHNINAMMGYEGYQYKWEDLGASRRDYDLTDFPYLNLGSEEKQTNSGSASHNAYRSFFGRIIYSYANKYLLQGNIRSDGSSRFAKSHRWGTFPSASAGWIISEEPWFNQNNKVIDFIKFHVSIGKLGNERIGSDFPYQALVNIGNIYIPNSNTGSMDVIKGAAQHDYAYNDITWETTTTYDVGLNLDLFNRLSFSGDWYYKKTTNMLISVSFPSHFGYNAPENNAADMHTIGWDVELSWKDHIGDLKYGANINLSDYRSRMGYMAGKENISHLYITEEGSYYNERYGYKSDGIILNNAAMYDKDGNKIAVLTGNDKPGCIRYQDIDGDGKITASNDRVRLGNSCPEMLYGGSIWADYKNFDFSLSFHGVGYQLRYMDSAWVQPYLWQFTNIQKFLIGNHWSSKNTDAQNAKMKYPLLTNLNSSSIYAPSDFWLYNGAYMRIKNITFGYTIPQDVTKKFFVNKLRLYFTINDLPAFSKNFPDGWDPEYTNTADQYLLTSFVFGAKLTF
jgi:TonB-linked SusC/RagA family outer membrane protein